MTTYLGKSCSFGLPRGPFVNCRQFMYLVISLLVLRAGCGIRLYQFLIIAYLFTLFVVNKQCTWSYLRNRSALAVNCWVIIHWLEVSCKGDQITSASELSAYNWPTNSELLLNNSRTTADLFLF